MFTLTNLSFSQSHFFYYYGQTIPLDLAVDKISICLRDDLYLIEIENFLMTQGVSGNFIPIKSVPLNNFYTFHTGNVINSNLINSLRNRPEVIFVNPVYLRNGIEAKVYDRFIVQFSSSVTHSQILELNAQHNVEIIRISAAYPNIYTFRLTQNSDHSVLDMANIYYQSLPTDWAMPDFIVQFELFTIPNDPYFNKQYYFHNTGQTGGINDADIDAPEAWNISTGSSNIIVAVVDEGIMSHPDLPASRIVVALCPSLCTLCQY